MALGDRVKRIWLEPTFALSVLRLQENGLLQSMSKAALRVHQPEQK